ncbi:MAG TPA: hypothetical protein VF017_05020 [Thermoanaerobaculia bacterium]|nr:hypothetical protein [Thermoanaerobaculia bacterium]
MKLKRIGVLSAGLTAALLYAGLALIIGAVISFLSLLGAGIGAASGEDMAWLAPLFGLGAIIVLPIVYGFFGFLGGVLSAFFYNLAARLTGGIELTLE